MLLNRIKFIFRSFKKDRTFLTINIFGLTVGILVALLAGFYILHQTSYEKFVKDYSLQTTWSVHLVYDLEDNEIILSQVLNELGLGKAEPIKSVGGNKSEWDFNDINELPISSKLTFWKGKVE